ncbi:DUF952 domain-containing protein [Streptomyces sp. t39]|uniref:DUF952 domain-containing protein n=1 Tax=Streptomyces sp. t39 TaxID=1828156 RepID=UPI0011CDAD8B|nr:DUF952 domain-containing protein [Streptomyces sp. t39]TXS51184.1 DUF952 domain-containing protein [Streptomyces sp. t39]
MIFHVVPEDRWSAGAPAPYAPASLAGEGFVHCSADEAAALAVADDRFRDVPGPLLVLTVDPARLSAEVRWEDAGGTSYPHVHGPVERGAVVAVSTVVRDGSGRATGLAPRP